MVFRALAGVAIFSLNTGVGTSQSNSTAAAMDRYLQPYVRGNSFAGEVLVERNGSTIFESSYSFADRGQHVRNTPATPRASMSMQFTAAAVLRLADKGLLKLDDHVGNFVSGIPGAEKITIRDLLTERSGLTLRWPSGAVSSLIPVDGDYFRRSLLLGSDQDWTRSIPTRHHTRLWFLARNADYPRVASVSVTQVGDLQY